MIRRPGHESSSPLHGSSTRSATGAAGKQKNPNLEDLLRAPLCTVSRESVEIWVLPAWQ
jgi:hypothetical protein